MATSKPTHQPIVIVKKVKAHGPHHSGAWKVAYADFVTAMMALFIVLWLLSSPEPVKKAVADYFNEPIGVRKPLGNGKPAVGDAKEVIKQDMGKLKERLEQSLHKIPDLQKLENQVSMNITSEGLRIELLENPNGCFFERGSAQPTALGTEVITVLAQELGKFPNDILLEGHTDSAPYGSTNGYTNWELSADRANAARRIMQARGVRADQVKAVRGYADQRLRDVKNPYDAANRRISVVVAYLANNGKPVEMQNLQDIDAKLKAAEATIKPAGIKSAPSRSKGGA